MGFAIVGLIIILPTPRPFGDVAIALAILGLALAYGILMVLRREDLR